MDRRGLLGKINYAGYCKVAGATHDGKPLPAWNDLAPETQEAWAGGAQAAAHAYWKDVEPDGTEQ